MRRAAGYAILALLAAAFVGVMVLDIGVIGAAIVLVACAVILGLLRLAFVLIEVDR